MTLSPALIASILVNSGYLLMLCGLLARELLWLRLILVFGQGILSVYGLYTMNWPVAFWNGLFVLINGYRAAQLILERRAVALPTTLADLHAGTFCTFAPAEFMQFWQRGNRITLQNEYLFREGDSNADLYCIIEGELEVDVAGKDIAHNRRGHFIGEMSVLSHQVVSADVQALGAVTLQHWSAAQLADLQLNKPLQWEKLKSAIGADLVEKIRAASRR